MRVYNEAGPVTTASQTGTNGAHADVDVFIGGFAGPDGNGLGFFSGLIDEVRVSNAARSNAWHDVDFATQRPGANAVSLGAAVSQVHVIER
jgi:hypothetical protein